MLTPIVVYDGSVMSTVEGVVSFGRDTGARRQVTVTPTVEGVKQPDAARTYLVPTSTRLSVHAGDRVSVGQLLTPPNSALRAGVAALTVARLNDAPTLDDLVDPESEERARRTARRKDDQTRREAARELQSRREAASEADDANGQDADTRKRARRLLAATASSALATAGAVPRGAARAAAGPVRSL